MRVFLCLLLAASSVQAGTNPATPSIMAPANTLPPKTVDAIQRISQNVLQARLIGRQQSDNNNDQITLLNTSLSKLIAVEAQTLQPGVINLIGGTSATTGTTSSLIARMTAQTQAWDVVSALRQDASQLQAQKNTPAQEQVYSGGFPVGEQRGRLFDKWADELEGIINNNNGNNLAQLRALQARLNIQQSNISNTPPPHSPTIQSRTLFDPSVPVTNNSNHKTSSH